MRKAEIIELARLQEKIDSIEKSLNEIVKSQAWTGNSSNKLTLYLPNTGNAIDAGDVPDLIAKVYILLNTEYSTFLGQLKAQRDELVICTGESSYKPVDIFEGN